MKKHLRTILSEILSPEDSTYAYNSYDVVGDIAIIRLPEKTKKHGQKIAQAIMAVHKNVKTVLAQTGAVCGEFRLRRLEHVNGENKTRTIHKESGCLFHVDVEKCYFSPRLFYERMRIAGQIRGHETVVNMFAGVGCFSILIAKYTNAEKVYSIDLNPAAVQDMLENVRLNRVYGRVIPILGDAKEVIKERLYQVAHRVIMPLPEKTWDYLPYALLALKNKGGWVHYYDFEHAKRGDDPVEKVKLRVSERLSTLDATFEIPFGRVVRSTGPNWYQVVLDIKAKLEEKRNEGAYEKADMTSPCSVLKVDTVNASFGVCGIDCEHCPIFLRKGNRCFGCNWINNKKRLIRERHEGCCFWECAQQKNLKSCFLCKEFPCQLHYGKEAVYTERSLQTWKELMKKGIVFQKP